MPPTPTPLPMPSHVPSGRGKQGQQVPPEQGNRTALVEDLMERFPHIPREAVLKEDLLRGGMAFDDSALSDTADKATGEVKPKSYFIFSFDHRTPCPSWARPRCGGRRRRSC